MKKNFLCNPGGAFGFHAILFPVSFRKPFDAQPPAGVLTLYRDTTIVLARDYFPSLKRVDNITSPHVQVLPYPNMDTVLVVVQEPAPLMTVLQVHTRRQTGDIPVRIQPGVATSKSGAEAYVAQQTEEDAPDRTTVAGFSAYMPRLAVFPSAPNTDALCNVLVEMGQ